MGRTYLIPLKSIRAPLKYIGTISLIYNAQLLNIKKTYFLLWFCSLKNHTSHAFTTQIHESAALSNHIMTVTSSSWGSSLNCQNTREPKHLRAGERVGCWLSVWSALLDIILHYRDSFHSVLMSEIITEPPVTTGVAKSTKAPLYHEQSSILI